jgi:hypothetical protein
MHHRKQHSPLFLHSKPATSTISGMERWIKWRLVQHHGKAISYAFPASGISSTPLPVRTDFGCGINDKFIAREYIGSVFNAQYIACRNVLHYIV